VWAPPEFQTVAATDEQSPIIGHEHDALDFAPAQGRERRRHEAAIELRESLEHSPVRICMQHRPNFRDERRAMRVRIAEYLRELIG
jgi:hypothetical protein